MWIDPHHGLRDARVLRQPPHEILDGPLGRRRFRKSNAHGRDCGRSRSKLVTRQTSAACRRQDVEHGRAHDAPATRGTFDQNGPTQELVISCKPGRLPLHRDSANILCTTE